MLSSVITLLLWTTCASWRVFAEKLLVDSDLWKKVLNPGTTDDDFVPRETIKPTVRSNFVWRISVTRSTLSTTVELEDKYQKYIQLIAETFQNDKKREEVKRKAKENYPAFLETMRMTGPEVFVDTVLEDDFITYSDLLAKKSMWKQNWPGILNLFDSMGKDGFVDLLKNIEMDVRSYPLDNSSTLFPTSTLLSSPYEIHLTTSLKPIYVEGRVTTSNKDAVQSSTTLSTFTNDPEKKSSQEQDISKCADELILGLHNISQMTHYLNRSTFQDYVWKLVSRTPFQTRKKKRKLEPGETHPPEETMYLSASYIIDDNDTNSWTYELATGVSEKTVRRIKYTLPPTWTTLKPGRKTKRKMTNRTKSVRKRRRNSTTLPWRH